MRETSLLKTLSHPNVLRFIGVFLKDGNVCAGGRASQKFIVCSSPPGALFILLDSPQLSVLTEYIDNGTLSKHILNKDVALPWQLRVEMAQDVAAGMSYLHEKNIIHRDLKVSQWLPAEVNHIEGQIHAVNFFFPVIYDRRKIAWCDRT